jgi:hypothetical protein
MNRRLLSAVAIVAASLATLYAQQFREPTAAERAVVTRYRDIVHDVLRRFPDENWAETIDDDIPDDFAVVPKTPGPLAVSEIIQASYRMTPGSPLYEREIAPLARQLASMKDPAAMTRLASQRKMDHFTVQFGFNVPAVSISPGPPANAGFKVAGTTLAYRVDNYLFDRGTSVRLLLGGWRAATWVPGENAYRFKFRNNGPAVAIENIVVQLDGSPERIDELLQSAPWSRLADALTK